MKRILIAPMLLVVVAAPLAAQPRLDASVGLGYAKTFDDEGSIGGGVSLAGDVLFRVAPRLGLGVRVERVHHSRDAGAGAFVVDGDSTIVGAEARFHFSGGLVQPSIHGGYGILSYAGTSVSGPSRDTLLVGGQLQPLPTLVTMHSGRAGVASGGVDVDVFIAPRLSIRPGVTFSLTQGAGESLPWMLWRSGVALAVHW